MNSAAPLVTVVITFLDGERFLEEAIESVLAQTYTHWELLLVDDGSRDGSSAIAREYADRIPSRIRYLEHPRHENRGISASRNAGVQAGRGDLIAFLDADDVWLPEKLERQVRLLELYPSAAMVYGATEHWYSWTGRREDRHRDQRRRLGVPGDTLVDPPDMIVRFLTGTAQTPGMCGMLVRREAFRRVGGFDERFRGMFDDVVFIFKVCLHERVFAESGSWDRYRKHPDSHSAIARATGRYAARRPNLSERIFLEWLEEYLRGDVPLTPEIRSALHAKLRVYRNPLRYRLAVARYWVRFAPRLLWESGWGFAHAVRERVMGTWHRAGARRQRAR